MGITGTWSGFVADTWTPYNYGSFGPGFGGGNVWADYSSRYGYKHSQGASLESSSIKIWGTNNSGSYDSMILIGYFGNINFTPYGTLHVLLDSCYNRNVEIEDTSGNYMAGHRGDSNTTEFSVNLSSVNVTGRIRIADNASAGLGSGQTETFHIYKIWFT